MCLISSIVLTSKGGGGRKEREKHKHSIPAQGHSPLLNLHTLLSVSLNKENKYHAKHYDVFRFRLYEEKITTFVNAVLL
jgi:hypothetical protein